MPMILPPLEIIKNIDIKDGKLILKGEVTEQQKKIFEEFKIRFENRGKRYE